MTSFDGECGETEVCSFGEENREDVHRCWGYQCARRQAVLGVRQRRDRQLRGLCVVLPRARSRHQD